MGTVVLTPENPEYWENRKMELTAQMLSGPMFKVAENMKKIITDLVDAERELYYYRKRYGSILEYKQ